MSYRAAFDRFTEHSTTERFHRTERHCVYVAYAFNSWCWFIADQAGNIVAGKRDGNMDAFQACEAAIKELESREAAPVGEASHNEPPPVVIAPR